jgi:hypothetical protein
MGAGLTINTSVCMRVSLHSGDEDSTQEKTHSIGALSRNVRIAVPVGSALMLVLLAVTTSLPGDVKTLFIPVFLFMVIVYVLASIYLFKTIMETDTPSR